MQRKQATGLDTRMMLPVYAAVFHLICLWFMPWISVPAMRMYRQEQTYSVFQLKTCIRNFVAAAGEKGPLAMWPFTPQELEMLNGGAVLMEVLAAAVMVLLLACIVLVLKKRAKSVPYVRAVYAVNGFYCLVSCIMVILANLFLNHRLGKPDTFLNMTLRSTLMVSSYTYAQLLISLGLLCFARRLMDVDREVGPQKYIERTMHEDHGMGKRTRMSLLLIAVAIPLVIFFGIFFLNDRSNVFIGICIICLAMIPFAMVFEDRQPQARELLLIAVISTLAVVGRMAFFMLPQFKPVTAIVIIAGVGLGAEAGFLCGATSGFVSNFFFGQGPWTPWQMFAYGLIGFLAGLLFNRCGSKRNKTRRWERVHLLAMCVYGALATFFIYGGLLDFSSALNFSQAFSWKILLAKMTSGLPFNLVHAASTVVFLYFLARPIERKLDRIKKKYGIMEI